MREFIFDHTNRHDAQAAPDVINLQWIVSATCPVCPPDRGSIRHDRISESLFCNTCNTSWSMDGTHGWKVK